MALLRPPHTLSLEVHSAWTPNGSTSPCVTCLPFFCSPHRCSWRICLVGSRAEQREHAAAVRVPATATALSPGDNVGLASTEIDEQRPARLALESADSAEVPHRTDKRMPGRIV